jgi:hypothetical protein
LDSGLVVSIYTNERRRDAYMAGDTSHISQSREYLHAKRIQKPDLIDGCGRVLC